MAEDGSLMEVGADGHVHAVPAPPRPRDPLGARFPTDPLAADGLGLTRDNWRHPACVGFQAQARARGWTEPRVARVLLSLLLMPLEDVHGGGSPASAPAS